MADVKFILEFDTAKGTASLKAFDEEMAKAGLHAGQTGNAVEQAGSKFGGMFKQVALGEAVWAGFKKAGEEVIGVVKDMVKGAIESEAAESDLRAALELTGQEVPKNMAYYEAYGAAVQKVTIYTKDQVMAAQALFVQQGYGQEATERATQATIGLAARMHTDLHSASEMVSRALEGNIGALTRYVGKVDDSLSPQQQVVAVLDKLAGAEGLAEKQAQTFGGQLTQLKNYWNDVLTEVGKALIQNPEVTKTIGDIKDKVVDLIASGKLAEWVKTTVEELKPMVQGMEKIGAVILLMAEKAGKGINVLSDDISVLSGKGMKDMEKLEGARDILQRLGHSTTNINEALTILSAKLHGYHDIILKDVTEPTKDASSAGKGLADGFRTNAQAIADAQTKLQAELIQSAGKGFGEQVEIAHLAYEKEKADIIKLGADKKTTEAMLVTAEQVYQNRLLDINIAANAKIITDTRDAAKEEKDSRLEGMEASGQAALALLQNREEVDTKLRALSWTGLQAELGNINDEWSAKQNELSKEYGANVWLYATLTALWGKYYKALEAEAKKAYTIAQIQKYASASASAINKGLSLIQQAYDATYSQNLAIIEKTYNKEMDLLDKKTTAAQKAADKEYDAQKDSLDAQYQADVDNINATVKNKTQRDAQLAALQKQHDADLKKLADDKQAADDKREADAEAAKEALEKQFQEKKYEYDLAAFRAKKKNDTAQAIIDTAAGIAEAIPDIFLMALAAAVGAAQIITIQSQPDPISPLDAGGILKTPMFSRGFVAAEKRPEWVGNLDDLAEAMTKALDKHDAKKSGGGGKVNQPVNIHVHSHLNGREIGLETKKTIQVALDQNQLQISAGNLK